MIPATANGGFPVPAAGGQKRVIEATHAGCSQSTRVSLPAALPLRAVRRIFCAHCECLFEAGEVLEVRPGVAQRAEALLPALPSLSLPSRFDLRWLTVPVAAVAVFAVLNVLNGDDAPAPAPESAPASAAKTSDARPAAREEAGSAKGNPPKKTPVPTDAQLIAESTYSLALPAGWDRINPAAGATFAAVAPDGSADATLWIQNDPKLDFPTFEATSLQQLETLAGSARVVERNVGPSVESSSITLAPKDVPEGSPTYEVVLRASENNWYYLATTSQAGAPADAVAGVDLIQGSFLPMGGKK